MKPTVHLIQIILAVILIVIVLIQQKGAGLGSTFGGGDLSFYRTKRGAEKLLFYLTIIISIAFIVSSLLGLIV